MIRLDLPSTSPKWPARLCELCTVLGGSPAPSERDSACGEVWVLLNVSLRRYLRLHASRLGCIPATDIEDIAATKALDLIRKAESGRSRALTERSHQIPAFLSTIARNGLVDHLRRTGRLVRILDHDSENGHATLRALTASAGGEPDRAAECAEFAAALCDCVERLQPRARLIWFFRVFYELSTKEIAKHPQVRLNPGHVDVVLQRAREHVTRCMNSKGHLAQDMPPGTFAELLRMYRLESPSQRGVA